MPILNQLFPTLMPFLVPVLLCRLTGISYEVDPLVCPKYQGSMKIIAFIEELDIIP